MDDPSELILKAVQTLPEAERQVVLRSLVGRALLRETPLETLSLHAGSQVALGHGRAWPQLGALHTLRQLAAGRPVAEIAIDIGVVADALSAALRHVAARPETSKPLAGLLERLAAGETIQESGVELGLSESEAAAELAPSEALVTAVGAAIMARAALPRPPGGSPAQGPLRTMPVRFPERQYERLKAWSESHGFPMAVVVRGLVERFLDEQERRGG
jgi:hypothetical protein